MSGPWALPVLGQAEAVPSVLAGLTPPLHSPLGRLDSEQSARQTLPVLRACAEALERAATGETTVISLGGLGPEALKSLEEALGVGEAWVKVQGLHGYDARESVLPGLWLVTTSDSSGRPLSRHLEVGDVPRVARAANTEATATLASLGAPPEGLMNALPVLAELRHRAPAWRPGTPNHVLSFTLLPLNEVDMGYLQQQLGHGPVRAESKGFGTCRVELTAVRNVWSVQHFNAVDKLILDTLEVGDVPSAIRAGPEDFEDAALRLHEWIEGIGR